MKPGRELDMLVAEKVMGLKRVQPNDSGLELVWEQDGRIVVLEELPHYSTDHNDAFEIIGRLKSSGFSFTLARWRGHPETDAWDAAFSRNQEPGDDDWVEEIDFAPHAICLAALKAMGVTPK